MSQDGPALPHEGWADVYDLVLRRTFGAELDLLTDTTVQLVTELVAPPGRIVDFGAGTGRVALPLADLGFRVTAVDPSPAMLSRLAEKQSAEAPVTRVVASVEQYRGAGDQDLALCVFSVLGYIVHRDQLRRAFRGMRSALRPGGAVVVDVPGADVLEGFEVEADDVLRHVEIAPVPGSPMLHAYRERTAVRNGAGEKRFEESFLIREWEPGEVVDVAAGEGLVLEEDVTHRFESWGAHYLVFRRR